MSPSELSPTDPATSRQLAGLTTLLSLEKEARHATDLAALGFICVNETLQLIPYEQAIFWQKRPGGSLLSPTKKIASSLSIVSISGVARFDSHAPQVVWLTHFINQHAEKSDGNRCHTLSADASDLSEKEAWLEWSPAQVLWVPLLDPLSGDSLAGLWLARDRVWSASEQRLAEHLADGYGQAVALLSNRSKRRLFSLVIPRTLRRILLSCLLVGVMTIQVRQSVLAPATVVAEQPTLISAPADGVVLHFHVVPNQSVIVGQPLFDLDPTEVNNRFQVATEEKAVAMAHYQKAESKAFQSPESGGELASLRALIARSTTQADYAEQLLLRLKVRAPIAGIVLFSDINQWLGRPVRVGERILSIADPDKIEVEILLPVADALVLKPGAETRLFLHTDPLHPLQGQLRYASYEASSTPEGFLAYRLRSVMLDTETDTPGKEKPRLGLKGTAKLFGEKVSLFFYLFHRPFSALRQKTGW